MMTNMQITPIPTKWVGPIKVAGNEISGEFEVPLATLEKPLWYTVARGAKLSMLGDGIDVVVVKEGMSRSIVLKGSSSLAVTEVARRLQQRREELVTVVAGTSRFTQLIDWHEKIVGNLLYLRLNFFVGEAAGHNMATKAADAILNWLLHQYPQLTYVSISGNFCVDKKVSAVNGILGRGKYVVAEMLIPVAKCLKILRTTPAAIVDLHIKKNLLGSIIAGSIGTANAHFANILLAVYLATGQDAANIVEGSQGIVNAELQGDDLYFSVTLPNLIVGVLGSGKDLAFARENLQRLGCTQTDLQNASQKDSNSLALQQRNNAANQIAESIAPSSGARRLASIIAAAVWCGEISLLAAQTNAGELVKSHMLLER